MFLKSFKYSEHVNNPQEWTLDDLDLGDKNLLVGRNATGKSRTLNVIWALARMFQGAPLTVGNYHCWFEHDNKEYEYQLSFSNGTVTNELLKIDGELKLTRDALGMGTIFAAALDGGIHMQFQLPAPIAAAIARRDLIQHPFLEPLHEWGAACRYYPFGTNFNKDHLMIFHPSGPAVDERDPNAVIGIFRNGLKEYGEAFLSALVEDLRKVDYKVETVGLAEPVSVQFQGVVPPGIVGLFVKETNLPGMTDQISMSQGMYRVLSLLIHITYCQAKGSASCLLIDDIGEGLDFDRSCRLISLLREKAEKTRLQLIMSTNDRFVMNKVPLEEWSYLQRHHNHVRARNINNARKIFEDFQFTGLSNFSFLELDVVNNPQEIEG